MVPAVPALADVANGWLRRLAALAPHCRALDFDAAELLEERARLRGLSVRDQVSPGGACHFFQAADGWLAINLPRDSDLELLPAWLQAEVTHVPLDTLASRIRGLSRGELLMQGRLLGLAVALPDTGETPPSPDLPRGRANVDSPSGRRPVVVDFSGLWAGPLCTDLLRRAGANVIKVESMTRPDGAREGEKTFYALLNQGKTAITFNPDRPDSLARLHALLSRADIVVEAARPRALRQLGIQASELMARNPRLTWVSITAHGRDEPAANWIGFGDDAGVAAGLSTPLHRATGAWQFMGDAIADPLTGIRAALVAWACYQRGGGALLDISLSGTAARALREAATSTELPAHFAHWWQSTLAGTPRVCAPRRRVTLPVAALGEHDNTLNQRLALPC